MMMPAARSLASCHGFLAVATDGPCGAVERPLFPPDGREPDFLVVKTRSRLAPRFPVVSTELVESVDHPRALVHLSVSRAALGRLPEHLPLSV